MVLRPSSLPKLAACSHYQSEPDDKVGEAAHRGTRLDRVLRQELGDSSIEASFLEAEEDILCIEWTVRTVRLLAGNAPIESREEHLRIQALGMQGTADVLCAEKGWSGDLKTGQVRNYLEQQAAYAIGFMERYAAPEWTVYLFYGDQQELVTLHYTRAQAEAIARAPMVAALDPVKLPTPNEYCGWCAKRFACRERLEGVAWWAGLNPATVDLTDLDPVKLGALMDTLHEVSKDNGILDELKVQAKEKVLKGITVPGWTMAAGRESKTVPALQIQANIGGRNLLRDAGTQKVFSELLALSGDRFTKLWADTYGEAPPPGIIQSSHGTSYLQKSRKKKAK